MDKYVKKYAKLYRNALKEQGFSDIDTMTESYEKKLENMYASGAYKAHDVYPTINTSLVYAVIAMCLELKEKGLSNQQILDFSDCVFRKRKKAFAILEKLIDRLPNAYKIAEKWNINDHENRVRDGSITYDVFDVEDGRIEYRISKCNYVAMFDYYGIRPLCKIFCRTDESAYANLTAKVRFTRYSDLSDGECCHDVIERKR
ncbi:MAG: L-2-amino-thiazoline-4-carboxylic acid hydrolase [Erysipelotrichaceae bacterium]|nr:L-2-amino-thiazoline-4-carboxylic acid hydrolase [Erysipelotrichaceae bacterium]